ncbi:NeuD/PglB/VioB family sugar acetyltransferase [Microvirga sp. STS02]|uniref:NeuD/PglB/VioB family sugar acetyltransferase n=1 Tax=Hymenobacter negativus TaxID=2795026 RepID=UPI0018DE1834|nr:MULTISPECIES: NeuD/PglB/VioB family sugar acetyltransferase [Bacteria]MBH8567833.1 NeuD/PglB/VioB family sugar acetyltransferase [Hymenobacter negativus]MBR7207569.1 NeuD/PglB/VioB family sugar acetyltransferase [Microvirga sp. STS02]
MLVLGARGHAIELLQVLEDIGETDLYFYDDVSPDAPAQLFGRYPVLRSPAEAMQHLHHDPRAALGIGGGRLRAQLAGRVRQWGGQLHSVVAHSANVGRHAVVLEPGLNVMQNVMVSNEVFVGEGSLINARAALHHNVVVGRYCEVSPGAQLLGHVRVGDYSQVGAGAVVLPRITIGQGATVGAGAVVTRHVADNEVVAGVPARPLLRKA